MCQMKENAMSRAGELPPDQIPVVGYNSAAVLALTQQMVDLAREIEGAGTTLMVSQAADILNAIRTLPVVDGAVQADLTKVMRGEITTLTAECERLAAKLNAPGVPQVLAAPSEESARAIRRAVKYLKEFNCTGPAEDLDALLTGHTQPQPTVPSEREKALNEAWQICIDQANRARSSAGAVRADACAAAIRALAQPGGAKA